MIPEQTSPVIESDPGGPAPLSSEPVRKMERSELLGLHTHPTSVGVNVHIYARDGSYLARGRHECRAFGETLGSDVAVAINKLRRLLVGIEDGTYIRSSERPNQQLRRGAPPKLSIRDLCDIYLTEKRQTVGKGTTQDYTSRLAHLIAYAEQPAVRRQWPTAAATNRDFVVGFRSFLAQRLVTRNGRTAGAAQPMSPSYMWLVLDCVRTLIGWAQKPAVNYLPAAMANPFTSDLVGSKPQSDPFRQVTFPLPERIALVAMMDEWQLSHLSWPLVLPLRPEDFAGLLIEDVDLTAKLIRFGSRFGGADFNKGRQEFHCPFPSELDWLLNLCRGQRLAGPLLRSRSVFQGERGPKLAVETTADVTHHIEAALRDAEPGVLQAPQDYKRVVRACFPKMGGLSDSSVAKEWRRLFEIRAPGSHRRRYDLRGSVSTELNAAGVSLLVQRYVTGHTTRDIMNDYVSLDPPEEMRRFFRTLAPLFDAIRQRGCELGVSGSPPTAVELSPR